jgi:hypothetical protein
MQFNLSEEEKRRITEHTLNAVDTDLYRELLAAGVEPESFTSIDDIDTDIYPDFIIYRQRISSLIARKIAIQEKLDSLP